MPRFRALLHTALTFACLLPLALGAQSTSGERSPAMLAALTKVQGQDFRGAAEAFAALTVDEPDNGPAWYWLGYARHALGEHRAALAAHEKAAEFESVRANASYNAGCAHALLGEAEAAFVWLTKARAAGFGNLQQLSTDTDLNSLRADPRFAGLFPIGEAARFVEDFEVLLTLNGEGPGDSFGWIGRNAGDTDGDGVADLLISAPFKHVGGPNAGRIYVYSGKTGALRFQCDGLPGAQLGIGIACAGDVNRDGVPDQLAGAHLAHGSGAAYVFSGEDGELLVELRGEAPGDQFARKVCGAGDQNGDGFDDLIVGAPGHDGNGPDAGRAYVYSGHTGEELWHLDGERAGDLFGSTVSAYSANGLQLLIVGASNAGEGQRGRVHVYRIEGGAPREAFRIESQPGDQNLGMMFVSAVGDVDGDGAVDVYGSDWNSNAGGIPGSGRIYVHSGADGRRLHELSGKAPGEGFGIGTAEAGDLDGDGCDDLLVGSWQDSKGAPGGGSCTLFSGKTGAVLATYTCTTPGETFGFDTTSLGDVNGDGAGDFLVTAGDSFVAGRRSGRVFVIAGPRLAGGD